MYGGSLLSIEKMPLKIQQKILDEVNNNDYISLPNCYHITSLIGCIRKTYYRSILPKEPVTLETAKNLYRGNHWDRLFTPCYRHNQIRVTYRCKNVPISISGHFDFIDDDDPNNPVVTDLKSPKTLFYIERDGKPSNNYRLQVLFYCYCTAIPKGRVAYWDGYNWLPFDIEATDESCQKLIEELEAKSHMLFMALKDGKAPVKNAFPTEPWECGYCNFKETCDSEA